MNTVRRASRSKLLYVAAFLTGCTTAYVKPSSGALANVTFVASPSVHLGVALVYDDVDCNHPQRIGAFGNPSGQLGPKLGELIAGGLEPRLTTQIPAGHRTSIYLQGDHKGFLCTITVDFVPADGETYNVDFGICRAQVSHVDKDGSIGPEPSFEKSAKQCQYKI